jgi:hypothetical protein
MKLYTEEIRKKAEAAWEGCHHCDEYDREFWINGYIHGALESQIELPSDEEMEGKKEYHRLSWKAGARWMREQIKKKIQKKLLIEIMQADEKDGLYENK